MTCIGSPSVALLSFTCGDFIEENSSKKFSRDPLASCCFLRLGAIRFLLDRTALADSCVVSAKWTGLQVLVHVWCLQRGLDCRCFIWHCYRTELLMSWQRRLNSPSKSYFETDLLSPYPNNFSLLPSLVNGKLEERLNTYESRLRKMYAYRGQFPEVGSFLPLCIIFYFIWHKNFSSHRCNFYLWIFTTESGF